jgi:S1-C subfamily serine protease
LILTNNHVIDGAQSLLVSLTDGRTFPGTLVGGDPQTDLAVVKINGSNLPIVTLGDSSKLRVGEWNVAIGNALALPGGPTVTNGVVSALGRSAQEPGSTKTSSGPILFDLIQTSAPINPGNSGGPLLNMAGEVIGINTLGAVEAEPGVQAQGISFAISINSARPIAQQLVQNGSVKHAYMGIDYTALTPSIIARLGTTQTQGVVTALLRGGPAESAGIRTKDIITTADNQKLTDETSLARVFLNHLPGDTITVTLVRGNSPQDVKVTLGATPISQ